MQQCRVAELMDDSTLESHRHLNALRGLARINRISRSAALVARPIATLAQKLGRPPRVLDVATGGGDVPASLARRGWRVDGCDISKRAVNYAKSRYPAINFFKLDVLRDAPPAGYDVVTCSLFLHHLEPDDAVHLLRFMASTAEKLVVVNDLNRTRLGYGAAWVGTRLLTRCDVVHIDGPRSVRAAWTPDEAIDLAERAGMHGASVRRRFPFRWVLTWRR